MGSILHGNTDPTQGIRQDIQNSEERLADLRLNKFRNKKKNQMRNIK